MGYESEPDFNSKPAASLWKRDRTFHLSVVVLATSVGMSAVLAFLGDAVERGFGSSVLKSIAGEAHEPNSRALIVGLLMLGLTQSHLAGVHMALFSEGTFARHKLQRFFQIEMWTMAGVTFAAFKLIRSDIELTFGRLCFATVLSATVAAISVCVLTGNQED